MKILVTGGAGFIGSAVIRLLIEKGHEVLNVDSLTYAACLKNLEKVAAHPKYKFEKADIRNRASIEKLFQNYEPDAVMHLAAESHVDRSIDAPSDFIETNIIGTFNLLEAAVVLVVKGSPENFRFHHINTDEVFGTLPKDPNSV